MRAHKIPQAAGLLAILISSFILVACSSVPQADDERPARESATVTARAKSSARTAKTSSDRRSTAVPQASTTSTPLPPADLVVFFAPGDARLSDEALNGIKDLAEQLKSDRDQDAQLTAKSDNMGSRSLCLALAANRLNALVSKLLQLGVRFDQLRQQNMGCENIKLANATCQTASCISPNERVEIRLTR